MSTKVPKDSQFHNFLSAVLTKIKFHLIAQPNCETAKTAMMVEHTSRSMPAYRDTCHI